MPTFFFSLVVHYRQPVRSGLDEKFWYVWDSWPIGARLPHYGTDWRLLPSALGFPFRHWAGVCWRSEPPPHWKSGLTGFLPRWAKWADININAPFWHCCIAVKPFAVKAENTKLRSKNEVLVIFFLFSHLGK